MTKKNLNEATKEVKKLQIAYQDLKATNKDLERDYKKRIEELSHFMSAIRLHSTIDKSVLTRSKSAVDKELDNGTN